MICHKFTHNLIKEDRKLVFLVNHLNTWYSTVVIWSRSFWSFSTSGTRLFAHYIYKYKYLYYSGGFDSIRFRF